MARLTFENITTYHQTQHVLDDTSQKGIELLIRCKDGQTPQEFINSLNLFKLNQLTIKLIQDGMRFTLSNPNQTCSVNVELRSFSEPSFAKDVAVIAKGFDCSKMILEITEHQIPSGTALSQIRENMLLLKKLGFKFSLDDYGTFHSHLIRLMVLPFDEIKVAKELFYEHFDSQNYEGLQTIVQLFEDLNYCVVIEGIETSCHEDFIKKLNIPNISLQGYYYSKPKPLE